MKKFIAHWRKSDETPQYVEEHLIGVSKLASEFSKKVGLYTSGKLGGLVHDLGKFSIDYLNYISSANGLLEPDCDDYVDSISLKGKIDHSTAGAQVIWRSLSQHGRAGKIIGQVLALCDASHHSGLIDCLIYNPVEDGFTRRMNKTDHRSHIIEALSNVDVSIIDRINKLLNDPELINELTRFLKHIEKRSPERSHNSVVAQFQMGLLIRLLFSCITDADRLNTADFEKPLAAKKRQIGKYVQWSVLIDRLESHLAAFKQKLPIDKIRQGVSDHCLNAASRPKGIYTLTVPTGGGKTLSSLRFALYHAQKHSFERIIFITPYTSIIDQNADVIRAILEPDDKYRGSIVLEHHSNVVQANRTWREKILSENWDSPVVCTTMVQFLEAVFGNRVQDARRMHQLTNAIIVFDEIQTLPIRCVHMFNNVVNFLVDHCGSTAIICTATQPLLGMVDEKKGSARINIDSELVPDTQNLFSILKRVEIVDRRKLGGWDGREIAEFALGQCDSVGNCLVVVNTKNAAKLVYSHLREQQDIPCYHLSTNMCQAHRKIVLAKVREHLDQNEHVICVSTQLIEAGIDIDFSSVIRSLTGLDSIAQAAGRCNRNGKRKLGSVFIVNPKHENIESLKDINEGSRNAERILNDFKQNPGRFNYDVIGPKAIEQYYKYYFFDRSGDMSYSVSSKRIGRDDTLLNLLSQNSEAVKDYVRVHGQAPDIYFRQSFMTAGRAFQAIDRMTHGVITQYGGGRALIDAIASEKDPDLQVKLIRQTQQFTVNIFINRFNELVGEGVIIEIGDLGMFYLHENHYDKDFGFVSDPVDEI